MGKIAATKTSENDGLESNAIVNFDRNDKQQQQLTATAPHSQAQPQIPPAPKPNSACVLLKTTTRKAEHQQCRPIFKPSCARSRPGAGVRG